MWRIILKNLHWQNIFLKTAKINANSED